MDDILGHEGVPRNGLGILVSTALFRSGALRFAKYYNIITEQVTHSHEYTFRYENFIQAGLLNGAKFGDSCNADLFRYCIKCGNRFLVKKNEKACSQCEKIS